MAPRSRLHLADLATPRISLGITGFARAGKTVFIGALAQALLTADHWRRQRGQGPLAGFGPFEQGRLRSARIRDDIHATLPQFPFRRVRDALCGQSSHWPEPTEGLSRLVLELDIEPSGRVARWLDRRHLATSRLQLELIDYPGEWLIDLPMLTQEYDDWSADMIRRSRLPHRAPLAERFHRMLDDLAPQGEADEEVLGQLADAWSEHLARAAAAGLTFNQPGRMLRPDNLRDSPVLRFAPLPVERGGAALRQAMKARYDLYRREVIRPFYRDHFARIDRQLVLVDVLRALQRGQPVFDEITEALGQTLESFRYGKGSLLSRIAGARTTRVLFAATKADHVTRGDRANLENMLRWMTAMADDRNRVRAGAAAVSVTTLASLRATEDYLTEKPPRREILRGRRADDPEPALWDPGGLPLDMPPDWPNLHFEFLDFAPPPAPRGPIEGFPALNLGKVLDFLISERPD
ncbi:MAG: YcjX family protein [Halothiobacillaceae bacterium]